VSSVQVNPARLSDGGISPEQLEHSHGIERVSSLVEHRDLFLFRIGGHEHVELGFQPAQRFRLERVLCQSPAERLVLRFLFDRHYENISDDVEWKV
jgi:hypothetical protein